MTAALYALTVLLWGFSWYAMAVQASYAEPFAAVCHRIALAALILMSALVVSGRVRRRPLQDHLVFMGEGACLFGLNFVLFYAASRFIPSGVMSICFASSTVWAALFARLFFGAPLSALQLAGAAMGVGGLALLMGDSDQFADRDAGYGLALGLCGAVLFALGNMLATRLQRRGVPQSEGVAWGMCYGAAGLALAAGLRGEALTPPLIAPYWISLLYLSIFGSVVAFTAYLTLVERLGAPRAAYATVLFPLVALVVSAVLEDFHPGWTTLAGFAAVLLGALLTLRRPDAVARRRPSPL